MNAAEIYLQYKLDNICLQNIFKIWDRTSISCINLVYFLLIGKQAKAQIKTIINKGVSKNWIRVYSNKHNILIINIIIVG